MKPNLLSGIKPEGHQQLGNYLGVTKNLTKLQNSGKYNCYFFIADLHSLTEDFDSQKKSRQIIDLVAEYLALGIDPKKSIIFLQSAIPAHTELLWLLTVITPEGELRRMTQYKDKVVIKKQETNMGLLMYPVLMAADILLYDSKFVSVGEDQLQHLELTRTLARKFNNRFGKIFVEPQPILTSTPRIMSLVEPTKKMSKSQPEGCLFLDDSPDEIKRKITKATTDSGCEIKYNPVEKPGISNLLNIYSALSETPVKKLEKKFAGKNYSFLKKSLAEVIIGYFTDFRKKKKSLLAQLDYLKEVLSRGNKKANSVALKKISLVKRKIGLSV